MPVDAKLKTLIEQKNIAPNQLEKEEVSTWLINKWIPFCIEILKEDSLFGMFKSILSDKIAEEDVSESYFSKVISSQFTKHFFVHLLIECNKDYSWFNLSKVNVSDFSEFAWRKMKKPLGDNYEIIGNKLKDHYKLAISEWLNEKLNTVNPEEKVDYYKNALNTYCKAYLAGLFKTHKNLQEVIKHSFNSLVNSHDTALIISQDNTSILFQVFSRFLSSNKISRINPLNIDHDASIINSVISNHLSTHFKQVVQSEYNYCLKEYLLNRANKDNLNNELIIHLEIINGDAKNDHMDFIPELIFKDVYKNITINNSDAPAFIYSKQTGVHLNLNFVNVSTADRIDAVNDILDNKVLLNELISKKKQEYTHFTNSICSNISYDIKKHIDVLAENSIPKNTSEFVFDETCPVYQHGKSGIKSYFLKLDQQYHRLLTTNAIDKGYELVLASKTLSKSTSPLTINVFKGINSYFKDMLTSSNDYISSCQKIIITLNQDNMDDEYINELGILIQFFDKANIAECYFNIKSLETHQVQALSQVLSCITRTYIRFDINSSFEHSMQLEAINDKQRQVKVSYYQTEHLKPIATKNEINNQPKPITKLKIKALMENVVELTPVKNKIGIQNQYQYQADIQEKAEVEIKQSWQITESKIIQQKNINRHDSITGDELSSLISWKHIEAALDRDHDQHDMACNKLGKEILQYQYKNRNLKDLWERLTGNIEVTEQNVEKKYEAEYEWLRYYSQHIPKQISYKTLLTIVRHPYLFQDGLNLLTLPDTLGYDVKHGALYTKQGKEIATSIDTKPNPYAIKINSIANADLPSAEHIDALINSDILSGKFYQCLLSVTTPYHAWHAWRKAFHSLNLLNLQGITRINNWIQQSFHSTNQSKRIMIDYIVLALNDYCYAKSTKQFPVMKADRIQFECEQNENHRRGEMHNLSPDDIHSLSVDWRNAAHDLVADIVNQEMLEGHLNTDNAHSYKQLLQVLFSYHLEKLPEIFKNKLASIKDTILDLFDSVSHVNGIKFLELFLAHDTSMIYSFCTMMHEINRIYGVKGWKDFNDFFISPAINICSITYSENQNLLTQLLQLSPIEYHWWQQLIHQHVENSCYCDFSIAMKTFQHFLRELQDLGVRDLLSMPCPLQGVSNIQIGLERIIQVLKKVKNPAEQMRNLSGLDWCIDGVVYALPQVEYHFLTQDMKLNAAEDVALRNVLKKNDNYYHDKPYSYEGLSLDTWLNDKIRYDLDYFNATATCLYRYIACNKYVAPISVYKQLLEAIILPHNYSVIHHITGILRVNSRIMTTIDYADDNYKYLILTNLLRIIAYSTTGQRALDTLPGTENERAIMLKAFIERVYDCSRQTWRDAEMQEKLKRMHAVSDKLLQDVFYFCIGLTKHKEEYVKENTVRLTMQELTTLLEWVKRSIHSNYEMSEKEYELILKSESTVQELKFDDIETIYKQLSRTKELLNKYGQGLIEAFTRIKKYNNNIDYASFVSICSYLNVVNLSFENKSRLLRIFSLIPFSHRAFTSEASRAVNLINKLVEYQDKIDHESLDNLLNILSSIVPTDDSSHFSLDSLSEIVAQFTDKIQHDKSIEIKFFILSFYKKFIIDPDMTEIKDVDFYKDPNQMELKFPNTGVYYDQIKVLLFHRYPVAFGENKQQAWDDFIGLIQKLENAAMQRQTLQMLSDSSHRIDLTSLNGWLMPLLNHSKDRYREKFKPELFNSLDNSLLLHENKYEFIKIINNWLDFSDWFSLNDHVGFIKILNKLAHLNKNQTKMPFDFKSFYDVVRGIALFSIRDHFPWYDKICQLIDLLNDKHEEINISNLFACLNGFFQENYNKKEYSYSTPFKNLIRFWLVNIENNIDYTLRLPQRWNPEHAEKCYQKLFILAHLTHFDQDLAWDFLLQLHDKELEQLAEIYESRPAPSIQLFTDLVHGKLTILTFYTQHISDPHHERDEKKLNQQFDDDILWSYINRAKYLNHEKSSPLLFSTQLFDQLKFINYLGRSEFRFLSSREIGNRLRQCRDLLANTDNNEKELTVYLSGFALIREAIYKTSYASGILWPTAVQTLAVLSAVNHQLQFDMDHPLFMQVATGEGKSLIIVVLALLTWLKGDPVTVVTHRASLALRDIKIYASLFNSLDIECEHLTANGHKSRHFMTRWIKKKAEFDGVYYAEFNDIASIMQQLLLDEGRDIGKMSFIIDEADDIFHSQLDNNLSYPVSDAETHPHAWAFQAIAAYIDQTVNDHPSLSVRIADLVQFICQEFPLAINTCQDPELLAVLPSYLKASWYARTLKVKNDFIPKKHQKQDVYYAAVLINDKDMPSNVTFNGLIHQALHGDLNHKSKLIKSFKQFHIAPETRLYSSMSPEAVLQQMSQCGTLVALSATIGSNAERMEIQQHFGFKFIKFPKMQNSLRQDYPQQLCKNKNEQMLAINEICRHYTDMRTPARGRAIVIDVESIDMAEKLNEYLLKANSNYNISMSHAAMDNFSDETLGEMEKQAGCMGHILIATSGTISRGFDPKLSTAKQVIVIATYIKDSAHETQVEGRSSRVNQFTGVRDKGKFYAVYDLETELSRYPENTNNINDIIAHPEAFKQRHYFSYYKHESSIRLYKQLTSITKNAIQTHFYSLWKSYFKNSHVPTMMRSKIMERFTEALEAISNVVPSGDFSLSPEESSIARDQYNKQLLASYEEFLSKLNFIRDDLLVDDVTEIISHLLNEIGINQNKLIKQYDMILQLEPNYPINSQGNWKQEKNTSRYSWNMFSNFIGGNEKSVQSHEDFSKMKEKKSKFIEQLHLIMNMDKPNKDKFSVYLSVYKEMMNNDANIDHISLFKNTMVRDVACVQCQIDRGQNIIFIHDPFIGMASQIHLISASMDLFIKFQTAIHNAYKIFNIEQPLQYRISKEQSHYQIIFDFSGHQFDSIDRKKLFSTLSKSFDQNTDILFDKKYALSLRVMKTLVSELHAMLIQDLKNIPDELTALFNFDLDSHSRTKYFNHFNLLVSQLACLSGIKHTLLREGIKALQHYHQFIEYQNQKGVTCFAYTSNFTNLAELVEIDIKKQAISFINKKVDEFAKSKMQDALLCKFQKDSLVQLGCEIASSGTNQTLFDVYQRWQQKKIQYMQKPISFSELMKLNKKETSYLFGTTCSPDANEVCDQIDKLRHDETSLNASKAMGYQ